MKVYGHDDLNICASPQVACVEHMLHVRVAPNEILQAGKHLTSFWRLLATHRTEI